MKALNGIPQYFLRPLALGDVPDTTLESNDGPVQVSPRNRCDECVEDRSVLFSEVSRVFLGEPRFRNKSNMSSRDLRD